MFVGILLLGTFVGGALGVMALISGASLGWALAVYICTGGLWILGAGIILMVRAASTHDPHPEQATAH